MNVRMMISTIACVALVTMGVPTAMAAQPESVADSYAATATVTQPATPAAEAGQGTSSSGEASAMMWEPKSESVDSPVSAEEAASSTADATVQRTGQFTPQADSWRYEDGNVYYIKDGNAVRGSLNIDGNWYRFSPEDGRMLTGSQNIDGNWYFFDGDGRMLFGSQYVDGNWYRYDVKNGYMLFGSQYFDESWHYYDMQEGYLYFGSHYIDGNWYRFDGGGCMLFGSQPIDGNWYYYDKTNGFMHFGFVRIDGLWYFYDTNAGYMLFGQQNVYGVDCHFHDWEGYLTDGDLLVYPYTFEQAVQTQVDKGLTHSYEDYTYYMDASNFPDGSAGFNQFLLLDQGYSGVGAADLDAYIAQNCVAWEVFYGRKSSMRGLGLAIVAASKSTGVNEVYIMAHAGLESAWGCSNLSTANVEGYEGFYNFYGIGAYDLDPDNGGAALAKKNNWDTAAKAITGGAEWIKKNYISRSFDIGDGQMVAQHTLYNMRFAPGLSNTWHQYATSITWPSSIARIITETYNQVGARNVAYEIPLYE